MLFFHMPPEVTPVRACFAAEGAFVTLRSKFRSLHYVFTQLLVTCKQLCVNKTPFVM